MELKKEPRNRFIHVSIKSILQRYPHNLMEKGESFQKNGTIGRPYMKKSTTPLYLIPFMKNNQNSPNS